MKKKIHKTATYCLMGALFFVKFLLTTYAAESTLMLKQNL